MKGRRDGKTRKKR